MIFEEVRAGGCCSYVIACGDTCAVALDGGMKAWREAGHPLEPSAPKG